MTTSTDIALLDRREAQCTATAKRTKQRCKRRPIPGGNVCVKHGGGAPQVKAAAERRLRLYKVHEEIATLGLRREVSPGEAIQEALERTAGDVSHLADQMESLESLDYTDNKGTRSPVPEVVLYRDSVRDLAQFGRIASQVGIEERREKRDQAELDAFLGAIDRGIRNAGLSLEAHEHLMASLAVEFRALEEL